MRGEGLRVVVEGDIYLRGGRGDDVVCHAGEDFSHVADANGTPDGGPEGGAGVEGDVEGVFVAFPFGEREEPAEGGEAEGDGFVGA